MKFIEDKLEALDEYFAPKKESEKWMVILGVAGIIAYLAYTFLLPATAHVRIKIPCWNGWNYGCPENL